MCFLIGPLRGWPTRLQSHLLIVLDDDRLRPETTWQTTPTSHAHPYGLVGPGHPSRVVASAPRRPRMNPATLATYSVAVRGLDARRQAPPAPLPPPSEESESGNAWSLREWRRTAPVAVRRAPMRL